MSDQKKIISAIADVLALQVQDIDPDAHFQDDLGLNPVEIADLLKSISDNFGIVFDSQEIIQVKTVGDLIELTEDKLLE